MKIPENINPSLVTSKDPARYILSNVRIAGQLVIATDGRRLLVACAESEDVDAQDADILVPAKAVNAACLKKRKDKSGQIRIGDQSVTLDDDDASTTFKCVCDGKFPNVKMVIPDIGKYTLRLSLNAEMLAGLAKAFGSGQVTLHLDPDGFTKEGVSSFYNPPMMVTAGRSNSFGVLMPCRPVSETSLADNKALGRLMAEDRKEEAQ